jgi:hypothetical protein
VQQNAANECNVYATFDLIEGLGCPEFVLRKLLKSCAAFSGPGVVVFCRGFCEKRVFLSGVLMVKTW